MYEVRIKRPALKDIARLPHDYPRLVSQQIDALAEDPRPHGVKKLRGDGGYRVRIGSYRILYDIRVYESLGLRPHQMMRLHFEPVPPPEEFAATD